MGGQQDILSSSMLQCAFSENRDNLTQPPHNDQAEKSAATPSATLESSFKYHCVNSLSVLQQNA
jgi:hypothetical protein